MARIARIATEGVPYHVTQRGNGHQTVFSSGSDYRLYLDLLRVNCGKAALDVWAFCLMPNHVHLIAIPRHSESLARCLGRAHADYARYFNLQRRGCGHVWQARYFSCPLDEAHLWRAMAYVERNPVRAGLVGEAGEWKWSSARAHCGGLVDWGLADFGRWREVFDSERWAKVLRTSIGEEALADRLRQATYRGRPLGSEEFIDVLERREHRRLRPLSAGRPKRKEGAENNGNGEVQRGLEIGD
jgi:putative transposase